MADSGQEPAGSGHFTKELQSGLHPMTLFYFRLEVLEKYLNDPRYYVRFYDFGGRLGANEQYKGSSPLGEADQVYLQSFGLAYNEDKSRALGVYLTRLSDLTPSHQLHWQLHQIPSGCKIVPDYFRTSIEALPPEYTSAYEAFLLEQVTINDIAAAMGKPVLFRQIYSDTRDRPLEFSLLLRPTRQGFADFVLVLDKLLSDNIDSEFFEDDVPRTREVHRKDGTIEVHNLGTITLLQNWLLFKLPSAEGYADKHIIEPMRHIRKLRQKPAHKISPDEYDTKYHDQQNKLILQAYGIVQALRKLLHSLPELEGFETPGWMGKSQIVVY